MKTTRRNFILTAVGGSLGALAGGCATAGGRTKSNTRHTGVILHEAQPLVPESLKP